MLTFPKVSARRCLKILMSTVTTKKSWRFVASLSKPTEGFLSENKFKISTTPTVDLLSGFLSPENALKSAEIVKFKTNSRGLRSDKQLIDPVEAKDHYLRALSKFLTKEYHDTVKKKHLVTTNGASASLLWLMEKLFPNKCPVFVEELSYFKALEVLRDRKNYQIIGVPFERDGINVRALERLFKLTRSLIYRNKIEETHGLWAVLYLVPAFHNPTGTVMPLEKRKRIIELARKYRILVVCDDVYNLLYFKANQPPTRLFAHDSTCDSDYFGNVISNGSFSKFWSPGIKMGWMELPEWIKDYWDLNSSGISDDVYLQTMTMEALINPLKSGAVSDFVAGLRRNYIEKTAIVQWILECELPEDCSFNAPRGGSFFWIELPKFMSAETVQKEALSRYGIIFLNGERCAANGAQNYQNCLRISISFNERKPLSRAVRELCSVIRDVHKSEKTSISFWVPGHA